MSLLVTDAVVLHVFDYLESSRILRVVTREAGVRSVLARGARKSSRRFGSALDLFAQGAAQIQTKAGRDLDTLAGFDVVRSRPALGADLARFAGASAIAELTMRFARDDADPALFDAVVSSLDAIAAASPSRAREVALAGAWRIVGELGFAPSVDECTDCHAALGEQETVRFSHPVGGVLCVRCARLASSGRMLPPEARAVLRAWVSGVPAALDGDGEIRAHQRLLREFLVEHLTDGRELRAFEVWEHEDWVLGAAAGARTGA